MTAMPLNEELGQQIVTQVNQLLSKNISICNSDGLVVASSYAERVGSIVADSLNLKTEQPQIVKHDGHTGVLTPLYFRGQPSASLIIYDDEAWQEHIKLVRSLAELLGERYLELQEPPTESKDRIIYRLLKTDELGQLDQISAEATLAGFDLAKSRIAILIRLSNFWQTFFKAETEADSRESNIIRFRHKIEQAFSGFFTSSSDNIVAYLGDDLFVVLKDIGNTTEDKFAELLKNNSQPIFAQIRNSIIKEITVGIGSYHPELAGLRQSYREAALALDLGQRMWGSDRIYHTNRLGLAGLIAETTNTKKGDFADRLLGPLLPHQELMRTMEAFFSHNLNLTNTAEALKIHRNTLIYRLDKITSIVNLDPRYFQEAVQIYLALLIKRILN